MSSYYTGNKVKDWLLLKLYELQGKCEYLQMNLDDEYDEPKKFITKAHSDVTAMEDWLLHGYHWYLSDGSQIKDEEDIRERIVQIKKKLDRIEAFCLEPLKTK